MTRLLLAGAAVTLALASTAVHAESFKLTSQSVADGRLKQSQFANSFGCTGGNLSPQLAWQGAPQGTKSYVVTMYDPDAPTGSGWWHWAVANIPANVTELKEGADSTNDGLPSGSVKVRGDSGEPGYLGACPPTGQTHKYVITVYALKVDKLDLPPQVTPAMLGFMTLGASLGKASLALKGSR